jgi:alkylated DNA nucleotide flippase Atl1
MKNDVADLPGELAKHIGDALNKKARGEQCWQWFRKIRRRGCIQQ